MIDLLELCAIDFKLLPLDHQLNLSRLYHALNILRSLYGGPLRVTSGYRSIQDHKRIYDEKNKLRIQSGLKPLSLPLGSKHLIGAAADFSDPLGDLKKWCMSNLSVLERLDLYMEDFEDTPGWVHMQVYAPGSGQRFFKP